MSILSKKVAIALILAGLSGAASAKETCTVEHILWFSFEVCTPVVEHPSPRVASAPEIDSSSAVAGLTLMLGGLAVMLGRRKNSAY